MSSDANRVPRVIPVIDVMGGKVVRAVGGRRAEYRPVESVLTKSSEPLEVAKAMIDVTAANSLYVADLDAITGRSIESRWVADLVDALPRTWVLVDQGIGSASDIARIPAWKRRNRIPIIGWDKRRNLIPVLGTETLHGPETAYKASNEFAPQLAVSIDLREWQLTGRWEAWKRLGIAGPSDVYGMTNAVLLASGASTLIVLDLAQVGSGAGVGTERWLEEFRDVWPTIDLVAGGGIDNWHDIDRLCEIGVDGVLVASAIHDGRLTFQRPGS